MTTWQAEATTAIRAGEESLNGIARRLHTSRASVQRLARSLNIKRTPDAAARALMKIRHAKLEGDLDRALQDAYNLRAMGEAKQDTRMWLAANKQILKILQMQAKAAPKLPATVEITENGFHGGGCRFTDLEFPPGTDQEITTRFSERVTSADEKRLPDSVPLIRCRIQWTTGEIGNDEALVHAEARRAAEGPDEIAAEPEARVPEGEQDDEPR
jgi:hypothetical protein